MVRRWCADGTEGVVDIPTRGGKRVALSRAARAANEPGVFKLLQTFLAGPFSHVHIGIRPFQPDL
jgi:hypothetical protein